MNSNHTFTYSAVDHRIEASLAMDEGTTREDAEALAAEFPKSLRVHGTTLSTYDHELRDRTGEYRHFTTGYVALSVNLQSTEKTGEFNETGLKRWASFKKHLDRLGYELEYTTPFTNSIPESELPF